MRSSTDDRGSIPAVILVRCCTLALRDLVPPARGLAGAGAAHGAKHPGECLQTAVQMELHSEMRSTLFLMFPSSKVSDVPQQ